MPLPDSAEGMLLCATPTQWLDRALDEQAILLMDHANCEKKAASTALSLMYRYVDKPDLLHKMSRLAREELRHFEQVLALMQSRGIEYKQIRSARYAASLHEHIAKQEPQRLIDTLLVGAIIEARSYERFKSLAPLLDEELSQFYSSLLKSEKRHFQDYLRLALPLCEEAVLLKRLAELLELERELIEGEDQQFRFHSGVPSLQMPSLPTP